MALEIKVLAYTFPAICIVMGALLLLTNQSLGNDELGRWGGNLIWIGAVSQGFYLVLRFLPRLLER